MYPHVRAWLEKLLKSKFRGAEIKVGDTSKKILSRWLFDNGFHKYFDDYQTYEIEVDVTGIIKREKAELAIVECKLNKITLRDVSQLLGYSKVANPILSMIVSPAEVSDSLNLLLNISRRYDVLNYSSGRQIVVAKWDETRKEIDVSTIIPKGTSI